MAPDQLTEFFDNPDFRGLWYVRIKGKGKQWTCTYLDEYNEYMETELKFTWQEAVEEAMKSCGVTSDAG